jgi:hypothetical protein
MNMKTTTLAEEVAALILNHEDLDYAVELVERAIQHAFAESQKDLLEACEDVITAAEIIDGEECPPPTEDVNYLHQTIKTARAAIAKAKKGE